MKAVLCGTLVLISIVFSSCTKSSGINCEYDPCRYTVPASEISQVQYYLQANAITATQHCSGLFYSIDTMGNGETPAICSEVSITYQGKLSDNSVFEETTTAVSYNLYNLIEGWKIGLPLVKEGSRIHLYIPPSLGYGNRWNGDIPPNSILIFRIDLISVN